MFDRDNTVMERDGATAGQPRTGRILIVDDERGMTRLIRGVAAALGFETYEVNDGRLATEAFIEFRPDILVLDLIMPGKDGFDVLNEVLVVDPDVRLVLISGYGDAGLRLAHSVSRFHRGDDAVLLRKPFRMEALRTVLQGMLVAGSRQCPCPRLAAAW